MIEETLERIAVALEKIALNGAGTVQEVTAQPQPTIEPFRELPKVDRAGIRKELDDLGIKYNVKTSTLNLQSILREAQMNKQAEVKPEAKKEEVSTVEEVKAPEPVVEQKVKQEEPAPKKTLTFEELQDLFAKYAAQNGTPKAIALLTKYGAVKLSQLSGANRVAFSEEL